MEILLSEIERHYLKNLIDTAPDDAIFVEYGCGGSTLFFGTELRANQQLYSVEHNKEWFDKVKHELEHYGLTKVHLFLRLPYGGKTLIRPTAEGSIAIPEEKLRPYSSEYEELPLGLENYIHAVNTGIQWPRVHAVFVDGIARGAVLVTVRLKITSAAKVLLHDAKDRQLWYRWAVEGVYDPIEMVDTMLVMEVPQSLL